jgi:hypothetical protein
MLHAPITNVDHLSFTPINGAHYFCVARQYSPRTILVHALIPVTCNFCVITNIMCTFYSTCYTMPKFSTLPPRTSTLRAPLTKLSCDNIYPHCARTNKIPLSSVNIMHTTHTIIMHAPNARTSITHAPLNMHCAMLNLVCTSTCRYFSHITTLHHATQNLSVQTRAPIFFAHYHVAPNLSAQIHAPIFFVHYHFASRSAKFKCTNPRANIFCALPLCTAQRQILACIAMHPYFPHITSFFTVHHAFLVHTPTHIHFYAHQFPMNSTAKIGAFAKKIPNFHHRHSETMKFVKFHPDNTNSTFATTNHCWLKFLEQIFPKLNSKIENFNQLISLHL